MPNAEIACVFCGETDHNKLVHGENNKYYCKACIESGEHNLTKCSSPNCDKYLTIDELYITGSGYMCEKHLKEMYFSCDCCHNPLKKKANGRQLPSGKYICDTCFEEKYFICPECGNIHKQEDTKIHSVNTRDGKKIKICDSCFKTNYIECKTCGEIVHRASTTSFNILNPETGKTEKIIGCNVCIKKKFEKCAFCGTWYYKNKMEKFIESDNCGNEKVYCKYCYYTERVIHEYNYKPKPKMMGKPSDKFADLYFGVENEIECPRTQKKFNVPELGTGERAEVDVQKHIAINVEKIIPEFLYQKRDGSLSYGIEIVSHPATIEHWYSMEEKLKDLFTFLNEMKCTSDTASTAGMHVHVSRKDITRGHKNNISAFVYCHKNMIQTLAGRSGNSFAKFKNVPNSARGSESELTSAICSSEDRYDAINWRNNHTMEMRMFQSTSKVNQFLSNIEFCLGTYLFTKENKIVELADESAWPRFCKFIEENEFRFLPNIMKEKQIWTS